MTVEVEYKGVTKRRTGLSAEAAYMLGAKTLYTYGNLLEGGDLKVRIVNARGESVSVMQREARPP